MLNKFIEKTVTATTLLQINFAQAWYRIFFKQWRIASIILVYNCVDLASYTLLPLAIGYILAQQSITLMIAILGYYLAIELVGWFFYQPALNRLYAQTRSSFWYSAHMYLLGIDPVYHVHRASGAIIGKIQRTAVAYFDFIHAVLDDVVQFVVEMGTVIVSAFLLNHSLGMLITVLILGLTIPFCYCMLRKTEALEQEVNTTEDTANQTGAETLAQFQFIRATFMSDRMKSLLHANSTGVVHSTMRLWMTYALLRGIFIVLYIISLGAVLALLFSRIQAGNITALYATTFIAMYLRAARRMFKLDQIVKEMVTSYRRIKDFYAFVHAFGKQSYPVFSEDQSVPLFTRLPAATAVQFEDVSFGYSEQKQIFDSLSFNLTVPVRDINKLYGIIGPSGVGKTTLLSLLGGQLKPTAGTVSINGSDIYTIDDEGRKILIALQGQIATSVRGTLRYNLLFGLPLSSHYEDAQLIALLKQVGLWSLFEYEYGLETLVGESGLSLSGGQRQRLNFANLYLRAQHYKPAVILIDEPTSSLDELSEAAITGMINTLAHTCVTIVIAHRLKTLDDAHMILDCSLIERDQKVVFYTREELLSESEYYRQLMTGKRNIEE